MTPEQRDAAIARNASYGSRRSFESRNRIIPSDSDWPLPGVPFWWDGPSPRLCTTYDPATGECRCPRD